MIVSNRVVTKLNSVSLEVAEPPPGISPIGVSVVVVLPPPGISPGADFPPPGISPENAVTERTATSVIAIKSLFMDCLLFEFEAHVRTLTSKFADRKDVLQGN